MSDISSLGTSNATSLLAALRQQLLAKAEGKSAGQTAVGGAGQANSMFGQADGDGDNSGQSGSVAATNSGTNQSISGTSASQFSPQVLNFLILVQEQSLSSGTDPGSVASSGSGPLPSQADASGSSGPEQQFFSALDTNGDGQISQSELESAFTSNGGTAQQADSVLKQLDTNGDGSVGSNELAAAAPQGHGHGHHHHGADAASGNGGVDGGLSAFLQGNAASGASGTTVTNANGSTTTTITYADGTSITLNSPAGASTGSSTNTSSVANGSSNSSSPTESKTEQILASLIQMQEQSLQNASQYTGVLSQAA